MSAADFKNLGNQAFKESKFQESIEYYSQAIALAPSDHILYSNRSGSYASLHKYQEALDDASKCIELNPQFVKGYQRKGLAQFYLDDFEDAIESYKKGLQIDPNNQPLKDGLKAAEERLSSEPDPLDFGGAGGNNPFGEVLKNPNIQRLFQILGQDPRTSKYVSDKSFTTMLTLLMMNPSSAGQFVQNDPRLQLAYQVIMENPEAQKIFFQDILGKMTGKSAQQPPGGEQPHQGQQHQQQQQAHHPTEPKHHETHDHHDHSHQQHQPHHNEPPKAHQKMEEEKPIDEAEKAKLEGNEQYKKKDFNTALKFYDQAIQLKPAEPLFYNNKAACYIELKDYQNALNAVDLGLQSMEDNHCHDFSKKAKLYARKGKVLHYLGQLDESITWFERSLLEDTQASVKDELKKVQKEKKDKESQAYINPEIAEQHNTKGGEAFKEGKFPIALKEYEEAIKRNPTEPKYHCNKATALMKLMEFPGALKDLDRCLELDPKYIKAYVKKGQCQLVMKDFKRAKDTYEKGLEIDPNNQEIIQGLEKVRSGIFTSGGESETEQKQRAARAATDPEIQQILREPEVINLLNEMQTNPQVAMQAMVKNKEMAGKIEKLIASGILKLG